MAVGPILSNGVHRLFLCIQQHVLCLEHIDVLVLIISSLVLPFVFSLGYVESSFTLVSILTKGLVGEEHMMRRV